MKRTAKLIYNVVCMVGCLVGVWHFFAPYSFQWFSYIPDAPIEIYQSVNYINFCFSFLLAGLSFLLLLVQNQVFGDSSGTRVFYLFFVLVWLSRLTIQLVWPWPWPSSLQPWLVVAFATEFIIAVIPAIYLLKNTKAKG